MTVAKLNESEASEIIDEVEHAIENWADFADASGVDRGSKEQIARSLDKLRTRKISTAALSNGVALLGVDLNVAHAAQ